MPTDNPIIEASRVSKRPRHSKTYWQKLILAYENSNLTAHAFCKHNGIAKSSFHKWRQRLAATNTAADFVDISEVVTPGNLTQPRLSDNPSSWQVELDLGHGLVIRVKSA